MFAFRISSNSLVGLTLIVALNFIGCSSASFAETESLQIAVGESHQLNLPTFAKMINLTDDSVVGIDRGKNKSIIVVTGRRVGATTVEVSLESGKTSRYLVRVTDPAALRAKLQSAAAQLKSITDLKVEVKGGRIHVSGRLRTRGDVQRLNGIKGQYPGIIVDVSEKKLPKTNTVVTTINRVLSTNDIANIQAHAYGKLIVLEGTPKTPAEAELALRIAKMILPDIEDRMNKKASAAPAVAIEVMFVEVQKNSGLKAGIQHQFGAEDAASGLVTSKMNPITGANGRLAWQVGPMSSFLTLIQKTGASRVLSNPKLVTRSGENARFHSGGTVYFANERIKDGTTTTELFPINYGIELDIEPILDRLGQIDTKIKTSVKDLGEVKDSTQPPAISGSSVETAVTIKNGQSILLSGLVNKKESKTVSRVPLLADIPIVGELFKHREIDTKEVELLILVTINRVSGSHESSTSPDELWRRGQNDVEFSFFD